MQALKQSSGAQKQQYESWRKLLLQCLANVEAVIDFGEEEGISEEVAEQVLPKVQQLGQLLQQHLITGAVLKLRHLSATLAWKLHACTCCSALCVMHKKNHSQLPVDPLLLFLICTVIFCFYLLMHGPFAFCQQLTVVLTCMPRGTAIIWQRVQEDNCGTQAS